MKIERKYMAHYLNAAFGSGDASYTRLGSDLEEYSPELTANVEKKSNIVGETTVTINGYQKQGEVSPYYAEAGDPLFEKLQEIIDGDLVLDDLKTDIVEVKLWGETADTTLQNARRLAALQAWVAAESAAGRAPRLGNCEPLTEQVRTEGGQLDRTDPGGTALYSIRVMAEYTMRYDT